MASAHSWVAQGALYAIVRDAFPTIVRVDTAATLPTRSVVTRGNAARWSLSLAQGRLFAGTADDRIISVPVEGGAPVVEVTDNVRSPGGIGIAGQRLY